MLPTVAEAVLAELRQLGQEMSALGAAALRLAGELDLRPAPTAAAALSRELRAVLAEARKGASAQADPLAELLARRRGHGA